MRRFVSPQMDNMDVETKRVRLEVMRMVLEETRVEMGISRSLTAAKVK